MLVEFRGMVARGNKTSSTTRINILTLANTETKGSKFCKEGRNKSERVKKSMKAQETLLEIEQ
jgi:hypothetical protein